MKSVFLKTLAVILVSTSLFFTSCGDEDPVNVTLHFHPTVGTSDMVLNQTYTINGVATQFTQVYFYAHGFTFVGADGAEDQEIDKYLLVNGGIMQYELGEVNPGTIAGMNFFIGVDTVNNHQTEENYTTRSADDPLAIQDPSMHWTWNSGYRFIRFEGLVDADGDGTPETPFLRHLGNDAMLRAISLTTSKEIMGTEQEIMMMYDLETILDGSDLIGTPTIHGMDANLMDKFQDAITVM